MEPGRKRHNFVWLAGDASWVSVAVQREACRHFRWLALAAAALVSSVSVSIPARSTRIQAQGPRLSRSPLPGYVSGLCRPVFCVLKVYPLLCVHRLVWPTPAVLLCTLRAAFSGSCSQSSQLRIVSKISDLTDEALSFSPTGTSDVKKPCHREALHCSFAKYQRHTCDGPPISGPPWLNKPLDYGTWLALLGKGPGRIMDDAAIAQERKRRANKGCVTTGSSSTHTHPSSTLHPSLTTEPSTLRLDPTPVPSFFGPGL